MAKKKTAGFKMKKSPNKSRFAAGTNRDYIKQFNNIMYGGNMSADQRSTAMQQLQADREQGMFPSSDTKPGNQTYGSYMGVPVKGNPVRPRGPRVNMKGGQRPLTTVPKHMRPEGIFGGGKPNAPRHIMAALGGNLYGRPKREEGISN